MMSVSSLTSVYADLATPFSQKYPQVGAVPRSHRCAVSHRLGASVLVGDER